MKAFIFDDAGTGKTKRSIDLFKDSPHVLVVCPANVVKSSWLPQVARWDETAQAITIKQYEQNGWPDTVKYLIVSYNSLQKISYLPDGFSLIVDESHYVKNPNATRSKQVKKIVEYADSTLMLTATPAPRSLEDMYGQLQVLYPQREERAQLFGPAYGTLTGFRRQYGKPSQHLFRGSPVTTWEYLESAAQQVSEKISNLILERHTSNLTLPAPEWIPTVKTEHEREMFARWHDDWQLAENVTAETASARANKMGQLDDGFAYSNDMTPFWFGDSKIQAFREWFENRSYSPVLVWTRYKAMQERLSQLGGVNAKEWVQSNRTTVPLFLIASPASMGTGVDGLQHVCNTQVWFDLPFTYADWEQANRRLVRRGTDFDTHHIIVFNTPYNRRLWEVVQGRETLDTILKGTLWQTL